LGGWSSGARNMPDIPSQCGRLWQLFLLSEKQGCLVGSMTPDLIGYHLQAYGVGFNPGAHEHLKSFPKRGSTWRSSMTSIAKVLHAAIGNGDTQMHRRKGKRHKGKFLDNASKIATRCAAVLKTHADRSGRSPRNANHLLLKGSSLHHKGSVGGCIAEPRPEHDPRRSVQPWIHQEGLQGAIEQTMP